MLVTLMNSPKLFLSSETLPLRLHDFHGCAPLATILKKTQLCGKSESGYHTRKYPLAFLLVFFLILGSLRTRWLFPSYKLVRARMRSHKSKKVSFLMHSTYDSAAPYVQGAKMLFMSLTIEDGKYCHGLCPLQLLEFLSQRSSDFSSRRRVRTSTNSLLHYDRSNALSDNLK